MLPQAALNAWTQLAPWPNDVDIEQDLIMSRAMIDIANHPLLSDELAFRGGTSLHKLHADKPWRYSNDLDYVHNGFRSDLDQLLRDPPDGYSLERAAAVVRDQLLARLEQR